MTSSKSTPVTSPDGIPVFGRLNADGNVDVLYVETGESVTRLEISVYPVGSPLSARYDHAEGLTLTVADAERIGLEIER